MSTHPDLPATSRALVVSSTSSPLKVEDVPTPQPRPGVAIVRILAASVISYMREIYNGKRQYAFPTPLIPGTSAIGRIAAVGPDATLLKPGDLVHVDCTIRGRDDPTAVFLSGIHEGYSSGSKVLMRGEWRDSTYCEYAKVPLENCDILNEKRLLGPLSENGLGCTVDDVSFISALLVPYGGLKDINLQAGETIIIAPATGQFGQAAVQVALAMGAGKVIAVGRNTTTLEKVASLNPVRISTVPMTGDLHTDTAALKSHGPADVYFDISPPQAAGSTHLKSCILALRHSGRVSLMGGIREDVAIPHSFFMHGNLLLKGKWMYERSDIKDMIRLVETGLLSIGGRAVHRFGLEEWAAAFDKAAEAPADESVVLKPSRGDVGLAKSVEVAVHYLQYPESRRKYKGPEI